MIQPKSSSQFKQFSTALSSVFYSFGFIAKHRLWWFFLVPAGLSLLLMLGYGQVGDYLSGLLEAQIQDWMGEYSVGEWVAKASYWVMRILVWYIFFTINKYIVLVLLSPVLSILSERTEKHLSGKEYPFSYGQLVKDILRGSVLALRNFALEMGITIVLSVVSFFFPIIAPIVPFFLLFVQSYYYGFSMFDYNFERLKMSRKESISFMNQHRGLAIGNGLFFTLMFYIPLVGMLIAPVMACVGATLALSKMEVIQPASTPTVKRRGARVY